LRSLRKLLAIAALLVVAACGSTTSGSSSPSPSGISKVDSIAAEVPSDVKAKGALQIATDATYAPNEAINPDTGAIVGWDIDFGNAIAAVMGIRFAWNNADFTTIIPDLGTRYDLGIASFSPTATREKTVDFVTYYQAGEQWFVKTGGPQISGPADMCGQTVTVETGTVEESDAYGFMGKNPDGSKISGDANNCAKAGKPDITVHSFTKQTDSNADLLSGHSTIAWADQPVSDYQVKLSNGQLTLSGKACSIAPYGIAIPKGSPLEQALTDAIKYLIDHGYYETILKNWNVQDGAIQSSAVGLNINTIPNQPSCVPSY
jgi:polar amino acid transport system substrate-binding protein